MKDIKRKALKGLTLIELIVVMAIFSILIVAILAFFSPVERIFKNTAISEKTYAYTNNIEETLQERLKYADALWVFNASKIDATDYGLAANGKVDDNEILNIAGDFAKKYYDGVVKYNNTTSSDYYATGKIHVMHIINGPVNSPGIEEGQITDRVLTFTCDPTAVNRITGTLEAEGATNKLINEAYFKGPDAKYYYHYALGSGRLVSGVTGPGSDKTFRVVDTDLNSDEIKLAYTNLNLSIVTCEKGDKYDLADVAFFANPCTLSVANLPLMNIVYCKGKTANRTIKQLPTNPSGAILPTATAGYAKQGDGMLMPASFLTKDDHGASFINDTMDFADDIYFIYSYADELQ